MLRLLGAFMIIGSSGLIGLIMANTYMTRPLNLYHLQLAIQLLETEINYARSSLPEACSRIAEQIKQPVASFFGEFAANLQSLESPTVIDAWNRALQILKEAGFLKEDLEIMAQLGNVLGQSDADDQIKHLSLLQNRLASAIKQAEQERDKNVRLWNYLGFCVGALVVLLLF